MMRVDLLGFEGGFPADVALAWGTAVLRVDDRILNPVTGSYSDVLSIQMLSSEGHVTLLENSIQLSNQSLEKPLVVASVSLKNPDNYLFIRDTGRMAGLVDHRRQSTRQVYVFPDQANYDIYANDVVSGILKQVLYKEKDMSEQRRLVRLALTARSDHPHAQALRAAFSERPVIAARIGRALLKTEQGCIEFDELFEALTSTATDYGLHYRDAPDIVGPTCGGGFDLGNAVRTFNSIRNAFIEAVRPSIEAIYTFMNGCIHEYRFKEMVAASAELHFSTSIPGESLGDRVGRHLAVRRLEKMLRGESIPGVEQSTVMNAAAKVAEPIPGVVLAQIPLGGNEERVSITQVSPTEEFVTTEFRMLAVQSGQVDDAARVELHISNKKKVLLSTQDNGHGGKPGGVVHLQESQSTLWQPLVATIERRIILSTKKEVCFLIQLERLMPESNPLEIDSAPSMIVSNAYVSGLKCSIRRGEGGEILTTWGDAGVVPLPTQGVGSNIHAMRKLFSKWDELIQTKELTTSLLHKLNWHIPVKFPKIKAYHRVLSAVWQAGGKARVSDVVAKIWSENDAQVRINNTRREVRTYPELMKLVGTMKDEIELTEAGQNYCRILNIIYERIDTENFECVKSR